MEILGDGFGCNVNRAFATSYGCSKDDIEAFVRQIRTVLHDHFMHGGQFDGYDVDVKVPAGLKCAELLLEYSRSMPRKID